MRLHDGTGLGLLSDELALLALLRFLVTEAVKECNELEVADRIA